MFNIRKKQEHINGKNNSGNAENILRIGKYKTIINSSDVIVGVLCAFVMLIGTCYDTNGEGSIRSLFADSMALFSSALGFICYAAIISLCFALFRKFLHWLSDSSKQLTASDIKVFLICFVIISVFWSPYIVLRYPAGQESDAAHQIAQFFGREKMTQHWPPFSSAFFGVFIWIGIRVFNSSDIGELLCVLVQGAICAAVLSYSVVLLKRMKTKRSILVFLTLIYSVVPLFPSYFTSIVKDALFSIVVLLFVLILANWLYLKSDVSWGDKVCFGIVALILCMLRNNGKYLLVFCIILGVVFYIASKNKRYSISAIIMVCVLFINYLYSGLILPSMGIENTTSVRETLSIPFQQTARFLRDNPEKVTEEEYEAIDAVLDASSIAQVYHPLLSDAVKETYKGNDQALKPYAKTWASQFTKDPICYVDATLANSYGFLYPHSEMRDGILNAAYYMPFEAQNESENNSVYKAYIYTLPHMIEQAEDNFLLSWICHIAIYSWLCLWCCLCALKQKNLSKIFLLCPIVVSLLICIASPTWWGNGFRYALPIVCTMPFLTVLCDDYLSPQK